MPLSSEQSLTMPSVGIPVGALVVRLGAWTQTTSFRACLAVVGSLSEARRKSGCRASA